ARVAHAAVYTCYQPQRSPRFPRKAAMLRGPGSKFVTLSPSERSAHAPANVDAHGRRVRAQIFQYAPTFAPAAFATSRDFTPCPAQRRAQRSSLAAESGPRGPAIKPSPPVGLTPEVRRRGARPIAADNPLQLTDHGLP